MSGGLKGLTLNTPPEEIAHIYAEDDAAIFQSIAGEDGVFTIGQQCKATTLSNNKIRIADGVVIIGGHFARIPYGEYEDCEIENGESGKKRNDIIVAVFETTGTGGIDKMHCVVKKGVAGLTAIDPELKQDDIYNNGKIRELPLYRVKIEGLSIVAVEQMFKLKSDMSTLNKSLFEQSLKGKSVQTGNYGKQWKINQTDYYSIGGKELLNQDSELYTTRESKITVKKPGTYLAILHAYAFSTSGGGTLWAKITVNNVERLINAARCQGYAGVDLCGILNLNAGDIVDGLLSATGDITSEGKDTLTLIRL